MEALTEADKLRIVQLEAKTQRLIAEFMTKHPDKTRMDAAVFAMNELEEEESDLLFRAELETRVAAGEPEAIAFLAQFEPKH